MELIKMTFVEADSMLEQYIRPHSIDLRPSSVKIFSEATDNGSRLSPMKLAKGAAGLFLPETKNAVKLRAHAPNDWDHKRIMFAMVVAVMQRDHSCEYEYIVGTTDHAGYTTSGTRVTFDRKMKLYFNNITRIHLSESSYRGNRVWQPKIQTHDQILNRDALRGFDNRRSRDLPVSLRPTDLFRRQSGSGEFGSFVQSRDLKVNNMCGAFTSQLKASSRRNNSTSNYLASTLSAYSAAAADPSLAHYGEDHDAETLRVANDKVDETVLERDPYLEEIRRNTRILDDGYITFGELMDLNPDFDEDRQLPFRNLSGNRQRIHNQAGWKGDDDETLAAIMISRGLPGIMIMSQYSEVRDLVINTRARQNEYKVVAGKISPYVDGISVKANWPYFESQVEDVLMHEITRGGVFEVEARIHANIDQFIEIWISVDGGEEAYFEFPVCMDALVAPTQDSDTKAFDSLSKGVMDLAAELSARRSSQDAGHTTTPSISLSSDVRRAREDSEHDRRDDRREERPRSGKTDW